MARGVNKVILVGNLGNDPEVRYSPSGSSVVTISLATTDSWQDKQSGERQEKTEWHRVVFFNRLAEVAAEYLRKGAQIYVEGKLQTRKWQDQNGQDRYSTEVVASEMQMLGSRMDHGSAHYNQAAPYSANPPAQHPTTPPIAEPTAYTQNTGRTPPPHSSPPSRNFDDDVPF